MATIRSLKPNVGRDEAIAHFTGGTLGFAREFWSGPLRSVAEFYIPFLTYEVSIANRGQQQKQLMGIDAVNGSLDPYHFEQLPGPDDTVSLDTRNCLRCALPADQAEKQLVTKVQRVLFTTGFFRMHNLAVRVCPLPGEIYVPYWVGFRGRGVSASFAVLDAVRRQPEGSRVRHMLQDWLIANTSTASASALPDNS
jgi:hypothetical protein